MRIGLPQPSEGMAVDRRYPLQRSHARQIAGKRHGELIHLQFAEGGNVVVGGTTTATQGTLTITLFSGIE